MTAVTALKVETATNTFLHWLGYAITSIVLTIASAAAVLYCLDMIVL